MNIMQRHFFDLNNVEVEVCKDERNRYFVRHNVYWYIAHNNKNPDPVSNCIIQNLDIMVNNRIETVKWAGYQFKFEKVFFEEDNMEVEAVLIPIRMFEYFMRYHTTNYKGTPPDNLCTRLGNWLKNHDFDSLAKNEI